MNDFINFIGVVFSALNSISIFGIPFFTLFAMGFIGILVIKFLRGKE